MSPRHQIPNHLVREVIERLDIIQVIGRRLALKKVGRNFFGVCPFHMEKSPSFSIDPKARLYFCFGCGKGGNVLQFVTDYEGRSFLSVFHDLAKEAGIDWKPADRKQLKHDELNALEAYHQHTKKALFSPAGAHAMAYLESRGINAEAAAKWGFGYADGSVPTGTTPELLEKVGLWRMKEDGSRRYPLYRNRLIFPIENPSGSIAGFTGRKLDSSEGPKYLNSVESEWFSKRTHMFGLHRTTGGRQVNELWLVEGPMDVIGTNEFAGIPAAAALGSSVSIEQMRLAVRMAKKVVTFFDGDTAGFKATVSAVKSYLGCANAASAELEIRFCSEDKDAFDISRAGGADAMRGSQHMGVEQFLMHWLHQEHPGDSLQARVDRMRAVGEILKVTSDPMMRSVMTSRLAVSLQISESDLTIASALPERKPVNTAVPSQIAMIMATLIAEPRLTEWMDMTDVLSWSPDPEHQLLASVVEAIKQGGADAGHAVVAAHGDSALLMQLRAAGEMGGVTPDASVLRAMIRPIGRQAASRALQAMAGGARDDEATRRAQRILAVMRQVG